MTCEIILTNMCGGGNVDIWLTCRRNGAGSNTTMDWGPWCRCNWLVETNQFQLSNYGKSLVLKWQVKGGVCKLRIVIEIF